MIKIKNQMNNKKTKFILGFFDDDEIVLKAIAIIREKGIPIHDVYTPFPIHGMDSALGLTYTRIPRAAFMIGATFCSIAFLTMWYLNAVDFPINFGGKPGASFPSFIPPTFEATVLTTGIGMAIIYMSVNYLVPSTKQHPIDLRITSDRFVMAFNTEELEDEAVLDQLLKSNGAIEVREQEIELDPSLVKAV